jgi:hypothetical protein
VKSSHTIPAYDAIFKANRDKPSGPSTTASPSIVKLLALIRRAAVAMADNRAVQSYALRL